MKAEPGKIKKAEAVNQLAVDNILTAGSHSYAWIERLLHRIFSDQNSINRFNAARIFGDICSKL
jgi:glucuronate isomerase